MALKIASIYIAAVIGAGFASGQEIVQFFTRYGLSAYVGVLLACAILAFGTHSAMLICHRKGLSTYTELIYYLEPGSGLFLDVGYSLFLLASVGIMFSGTAALVSNLGYAGGRLVTVVLVGLTVAKGASFTLSASEKLVPVLVMLTLGVTLGSLWKHGLHLSSANDIAGVGAGVLYGSYNLGFAIAVLAGISPLVGKRVELTMGTVIGTVGLGVLLLPMVIALQSFGQAATSQALPMLVLAESLGAVWKHSFAVLLYLAMFTTAVANSLAIATRLKRQTTLSWILCCALTLVVTFSLSFFGFVSLIKTAYPLFGFIGLFMIYRLLRGR